MTRYQIARSYESSTNKGLASALHIATAIAAFMSGGMADILIPLIAYFITDKNDSFLREHIRQQLNFQITRVVVTIAAVLLAIFTLGLGLIVAVPVIVLMTVVDVVASILAARAASHGAHYRFPLSADFIRADRAIDAEYSDY